MNEQAEVASIRERFRELHLGTAPLLLGNAWDAGSARILSELGYAAIATTSAGMAWTYGLRDGAAHRERAFANARLIAAATSLPVNADLENGFGDSPEEVAETIRMADGTGIAGASIEDANGDADRPIYDVELAVERIAAAVEANRKLPVPLVLTARAENYLHGRLDLADTIRRLVAFERSGADVLFAPGLPNLDAVREVCGALSKPVNVLVAGGAAIWSVADIAKAGGRRISVGSGFARVAYGAFIAAAIEAKDRGTFLSTSKAPSHSAVNATMTAVRTSGGKAPSAAPRT